MNNPTRDFKNAARPKTPSWDDVEVGDVIAYEAHSKVVDKTDEYLIVQSHPVVGQGRAFLKRKQLTWTLKSVEKPVVTFKPGDVVRTLSKPYRYYTIRADEFFDHDECRWNDLDDEGNWPFTSRHYELVED